MRQLSLLVFLCAACEGTIFPLGGGPGGGAGAGSAGGSELCAEPLPPAEAPLTRLSTLQYRNTVRDLLTQSGLGTLGTELLPKLDTVPDDSDVSFRSLDQRVTEQHLAAWFDVAVAVGDAIEASPSRLTALAGSCAAVSPLTSACVDAFLGSFGRRALRRPLAADELESLRALNDGQRRPAEAIRAMVIRLLLSPHFVNHLELEGEERAPQNLRLSAYELASKLSYTFWQTLPDDALLAAAADGSLLTDDGFRAELDRVFEDPRTRATLWSFWSEWLRLEKFTGFATQRPAFAALAAGENPKWGDMVDEVRELTALYTFEQRGSFADLLASDVSVTRSTDLARLYGIGTWSGSGERPRLPNRKGLLQRAALLVDGLEQTNPFHRGAMTRRAFLCDPLPQPNPAALPPGSLDPPPFDANQTTRQRFQAKVQGNDLCQGCHGSFSDLGYVLEQFDALGRHRTTERVFDEASGALLAELPLDTTAVARVETGDLTAVSGPADLNARIVESGKASRCFAQSYTRFALRREPRPNTADACAVAALGQRGLTLEQVFKGLALQPGFRERRVGER